MDIRFLNFLTDREKNILYKNRINTFEELLYYFPFRYEDAPSEKLIQDLKPGDSVTISGIITDIEAKTGYHSGSKFTKAVVADSTESIEVIWWNMPFIAKSLHIDQKVVLTGTVAEKNGNIFLSSPKVSKVKEISINATDTLFQKEKDETKYSVYSEIRKEKNFKIGKIIEKAIKSTEFKSIQNLIPEEIAKNLNLGSRQNAILRRHFPQTEADIKWTAKYFAFEEIFVLQVYRAREKSLRKDAHSYEIKLAKDFYENMDSILPFKLTKGQNTVLETILKDLQKNKPMSRLVEGDVGSGKTILALAASLATINTQFPNKKRLQVAYIAPTEILATQHFETFIKVLSSENKTIALLTRTGAKIYPSKIDREQYTTAPKSRVKKLLDDGRIDIVIGTHALFNKSILFENLGLVIIDEQHRFGVKQRMNLIEKHKVRAVEKKTSRAKNDLSYTEDDLEDELKIYPIPHLLSMSATPIPRTLALTIYGDLDLSVLDELPPGRKRAKTIVLKNIDRATAYRKLEEYLANKKQAYIIAPRIKDDEDNEETTKKKTSVEFEAKRIKEKFPNVRTGIMHGKLNKQEKEKVIEEFYKGNIDVLISTTVVEVGVSVPNATFIMIENADTFGLAQLHQLRGRVERSTSESICYLMTESEDENSLKRLGALEKSNNGFELAEVDMLERGPGSLIGARQSGLSDIGMEAIKNRKLVEFAKESADKLLEEDPELSKYLYLKNKIDEFSVHEE